MALFRTIRRTARRGLIGQFAIATGLEDVVGSAAIDTGLNSIDSFAVSLGAANATLANRAVAVSGVASGATLTIRAWAPGGPSTSTLVAAAATAAVSWMAIGT